VGPFARSGRMPRESLGAPEDLPKEAPCQLTFGECDFRRVTFGELEGRVAGALFGRSVLRPAAGQDPP